MKKEIIYSSGNYLRDEFKIEGYLFEMCIRDRYYFKPIRELPTGRGFADFVFVPKPEYKADYPALIVELKWNQNVSTALNPVSYTHLKDSGDPAEHLQWRRTTDPEDRWR